MLNKLQSDPHVKEQRTQHTREQTRNELTEALTNDGYTIVQETAFVVPGTDAPQYQISEGTVHSGPTRIVPQFWAYRRTPEPHLIAGLDPDDLTARMRPLLETLEESGVGLAQVLGTDEESPAMDEYTPLRAPEDRSKVDQAEPDASLVNQLEAQHRFRTQLDMESMTHLPVSAISPKGTGFRCRAAMADDRITLYLVRPGGYVLGFHTPADREPRFLDDREAFDAVVEDAPADSVLGVDTSTERLLEEEIGKIRAVPDAVYSRLMEHRGQPMRAYLQLPVDPLGDDSAILDAYQRLMRAYSVFRGLYVEPAEG